MTIIRALAVALALAAIAVPTAQAKPMPEPTGLDYSRNAVTGEYIPVPDGAGPQDFRHPDTIDAANGRGPETVPDVTVVKVPTPAPAPVSSDGGLDWTDAGIGAGGMLAMIAIAGGAAVAVVHRRRGFRPVA